jgi:hypothetical protein
MNRNRRFAERPARGLSRAAGRRNARAYVPPGETDGRDREEADFVRYVAPPMSLADLGSRFRVTVNSVPKSGTVWMAAMLAHLLGLDVDRQVVLTHVNDIRAGRLDPDLQGTVVVVRDLRDVVVSWHHELVRSDARCGFPGPRYPTAEAFYFEHFIGLVRSSPRYAHGRLEEWLDYVTGRGYPLVRYEDMMADPSAALGKVLRFWKIDVPAEAIVETAAAHAFARMPATVARTPGFVRRMVQAGHLRRGVVGSWRDELPAAVQDDIASRFGEYQSRGGYR